MKKLLVTGSSGLIGSEVCIHFASLGWQVNGVDNNQRAVFFGSQGDTRWNQQRLQGSIKGFVHHEVDIRDRQGVLNLIDSLRPDAIVHTAAQPSHDLAAQIPFDDFDTNAVGTLNLLEATRQFAPDAPFVHLSTNKVYGDAPNEIPMTELETRWDYADPNYENGIPETFRIDQSKHSLFGASKVAADVMVVPSRLDNLPNTGLEAQACGTPVVAFRHSGLTDVVTEGVTGLLADPFEPQSLAQSILTVIRDPDYQKQLGAAARNKAERQWAPTVVAKQYAELYQSIL